MDSQATIKHNWQMVEIRRGSLSATEHLRYIRLQEAAGKRTHNEDDDCDCS